MLVCAEKVDAASQRVLRCSGKTGARHRYLAMPEIPDSFSVENILSGRKATYSRINVETWNVFIFDNGVITEEIIDMVKAESSYRYATSMQATYRVS